MQVSIKISFEIFYDPAQHFSGHKSCGNFNRTEQKTFISTHSLIEHVTGNSHNIIKNLWRKSGKLHS